MFGITPDRKHAVAERWLALTIETYPPQARPFLLDEKDPFRNPVGQTLRDNIPALVDELFGEMDSKGLSQSLDPLVRLRAVQQFTPREAVGFVFLLKTALRQELTLPADTLRELESRVDLMALAAFDFFVRCREQIHEIQANEVMRRTSVRAKRCSGEAGR